MKKNIKATIQICFGIIQNKREAFYQCQYMYIDDIVDFPIENNYLTILTHYNKFLRYLQVVDAIKL